MSDLEIYHVVLLYLLSQLASLLPTGTYFVTDPY